MNFSHAPNLTKSLNFKETIIISYTYLAYQKIVPIFSGNSIFYKSLYLTFLFNNGFSTTLKIESAIIIPTANPIAP